MMKRRFWKPVIGISVLMAGVGIAVVRGPISWAQDDPLKEQVELKFKEFDRNQDGIVTPDEFGLEDAFAKLDGNSDSKLEVAEVIRALRSNAELRESLRDAKPMTKSGQDESQDLAVRQGPKILHPGEQGIGRRIAEFTGKDVLGKEVSLKGTKDGQFTVIAMTSTSCPLSKKYLNPLVSLSDREEFRSFNWIFVNPIATDDEGEVQDAAKLMKRNAQYLFDKDESIARGIGAKRTTDVIVVDSALTVLYHGAVDDQYGFGYSLDAPKNEYLVDALRAIQRGESPEVAATDSPGCYLELGEENKSADANSLTYHSRISRIVQAKCIECHRTGGVAPFSLDSYEDVVAHAGMIEEVVKSGTMPPWFAVPTEEQQSRAIWANDRSFAQSEKEDLLSWLNGPKTEGETSTAPLVKKSDPDWLIGTPDQVFEFAKPIKIKANGTMPYQDVYIETNLADDKWVKAVEIKPGEKSVVHHVLVFVQNADSRKSDAEDETSGFWAAYVPGNSHVTFPESFAKLLPKNARLRFQMHYTPDGSAKEDKTKIGLIYADKKPEHEVKVAGIANLRIRIPANAPNHPETASIKVPADVKVLSFMPHMHLRGKACRYELVRNGDAETLLDIPRYDFNWQLGYRFYEPVEVKRGESLKFTAWYDNSKSNPANPAPDREVRWGPQTEDEMHIGYVEYYVPGEAPGTNSASPAPNAGRGGRQRQMSEEELKAAFKRLDKDNNGTVEIEELPDQQRNALSRLDSDKDGSITMEEASKLLNR